MKRIIIIGAGGFGKELYSYIMDDIAKKHLKEVVFKGFIDDSHENFLAAGFSKELYLGRVKEYAYSKDDYVLIAIGNVQVRNGIKVILENKKVNFFTYIHSSAFVAPDAKIGEGVIVSPFSMIQANSVVGAFSVLNIYCSVGHDSILGEGSVLSPYCTLNGNVVTGENLFMGTRASILLAKKVGDECMISAHTCVGSNIQDGMIIKQKPIMQEVKNRFLRR